VVPRIERGPLILFVAAAILLADFAVVWIGSQADFGFDFSCCYQQAGQRAIRDPSTLYAWSDTYTFRYTPMGALFFAPLAGISDSAAAVVWLVFKLIALALTAAWFVRDWPRQDRWLVALLVLTFPPIVHDLVIGNISTLTTLVLLAVVRWPNARGGVVMGVLVALAPKPHLLPVLVWMAFRQRGAFAATAATSLAIVAAGLLIFGLDPWLAFLGTLREPLDRTFTANIGFSSWLGPVGVAVGVVAAAVLLVLALRREGTNGFGLAIVSGIVMGPYTFIHYLSGTLIAVMPVLRTRPRLLVPFPWLLIVFPLIPIWLLVLGWVLWRRPAEAAAQQAAAPG
jgi:hypothetical protein